MSNDLITKHTSNPSGVKSGTSSDNKYLNTGILGIKSPSIEFEPPLPLCVESMEIKMRCVIASALIGVLCVGATALTVLGGDIDPVLRQKIDTALADIEKEYHIGWELVDVITTEYQLVLGDRWAVEAKLRRNEITAVCQLEIFEGTSNEREITLVCPGETPLIITRDE